MLRDRVRTTSAFSPVFSWAISSAVKKMSQGDLAILSLLQATLTGQPYNAADGARRLGRGKDGLLRTRGCRLQWPWPPAEQRGLLQASAADPPESCHSACGVPTAAGCQQARRLRFSLVSSSETRGSACVHPFALWPPACMPTPPPPAFLAQAGADQSAVLHVGMR